MPKIRFTADEKAKAVLRHFQDDVPISTICAELSIHPNVFYAWQKQLFSSARKAYSEHALQIVISALDDYTPSPMGFRASFDMYSTFFLRKLA